jgi:hypothetical protein
MMGNLDEDKVKLMLNYSIAGLTEGKDYNITVNTQNRKIFFKLFYFIDSSETSFTVHNKVNFVSIAGQPLTNQHFNLRTRLLQA